MTTATKSQKRYSTNGTFKIQKNNWVDGVNSPAREEMECHLVGHVAIHPAIGIKQRTYVVSVISIGQSISHHLGGMTFPQALRFAELANAALTTEGFEGTIENNHLNALGGLVRVVRSAENVFNVEFEIETQVDKEPQLSIEPITAKDFLSELEISLDDLKDLTAVDDTGSPLELRLIAKGFSGWLRHGAYGVISDADRIVDYLQRFETGLIEPSEWQTRSGIPYDMKRLGERLPVVKEVVRYYAEQNIFSLSDLT